MRANRDPIGESLGASRRWRQRYASGFAHLAIAVILDSLGHGELLKLLCSCFGCLDSRCYPFRSQLHRLNGLIILFLVVPTLLFLSSPELCL